MKLNLLQYLKNQFDIRSESDKKIILVLFVLLSLMLLGSWTRKSFDYRSSAVKNFQENRDFLYSINASADIIKSSKNTLGASGNQSILALVSESAQKQEFVFARIQPEGDDSIKLWMDRVYFNNLISWLYFLESSHGISVRQISVERVDEGFVSVRLTLGR